MKLQRAALVHFLDKKFGGATSPVWYRIGKDVEDLSINLNPSIEQRTNILDETSIEDNGYEPSADVETYYADPDDGDLYTKIKNIVMNRLKGDECKTTYLEAIIDQTEFAEGTTPSWEAWTEDVYVKPTSYGGATGGVRIPYTINFAGNRKKGTITLSAAGVPTFTADT